MIRRGAVHRFGWSRLSFACLALLSFGLSACLPTFKGMRPVTKAELKPEKSKGPRASAEYLFVERNIKLLSGRAYHQNYMRIRFNSRKGFRHATHRIVGLELEDLDVRTVCPDGRTAKLNKEQLQKTGESLSSPRGLYQWSRRMYKFTIPGVGKGCVADIYWSGFGRHPSELRWGVLNNIPVKKASYRFEYGGQSRVYRALLHNMESVWLRLSQKTGKTVAELSKAANDEKSKAPADSTLPVRLAHDLDASRIELHLKDIPAKVSPRSFSRKIKQELLPPRFRKSAFCRISLIKTTGMTSAKDYYVDWKNIDSSFTKPSGLFQETRSRTQRHFQLDEEQEMKAEGLPAIAVKLTSGSKKQSDAVYKIYEHLRQRMKRTGRSMSSANKLFKVYQLGQGSSYEINMIYIVMLRSLGIRAYPSLVAGGDRRYHMGLPDDTPFGYILTYIASGKAGKWKGLREEQSASESFLSEQTEEFRGGLETKGGLVLDPSDKFLPFGALHEAEKGVKVFVVDGRGGKFFQTPDISAKNNSMTIALKATIGKDGSFKGKTTVRYTGELTTSARHRFDGAPKHSWKNKGLFGGFIKKYCGNHTQIKMSEQPNLAVKTPKNPFLYSYDFAVSSCIPYAKKAFFFRPLLKSLISLPSLRSKKRFASIHLGTPRTFQYNLEYAFPKGFRIKRKGFEKKLSAPGLEASVTFSPSAKGLKIQVSMTRKKRELPASDYPKVQQFFMQLRKLTQQQVLVWSK